MTLKTFALRTGAASVALTGPVQVLAKVKSGKQRIHFALLEINDEVVNVFLAVAVPGIGHRQVPGECCGAGTSKSGGVR